jgi:hypothetical protein
VHGTLRDAPMGLRYERNSDSCLSEPVIKREKICICRYHKSCNSSELGFLVAIYFWSQLSERNYSHLFSLMWTLEKQTLGIKINI